MQSFVGTIAQVSQLFWDGKLDAARDLLISTRQACVMRLSLLEAELEMERRNLQQIEALMPPDTKSSGGLGALENSSESHSNQKSLSDEALRALGLLPTAGLLALSVAARDEALDKLSPVKRELRRKKVIETALEMTPEFGSIITAEALAFSLEAMQVELGVPPNRVNTTIGNILAHSPFYKNAGPGMYVRVRADDE